MSRGDRGSDQGALCFGRVTLVDLETRRQKNILAALTSPWGLRARVSSPRLPPEGAGKVDTAPLRAAQKVEPVRPGPGPSSGLAPATSETGKRSGFKHHEANKSN
jgi:hypothetical protein